MNTLFHFTKTKFNLKQVPKWSKNLCTGSWPFKYSQTDMSKTGLTKILTEQMKFFLKNPFLYPKIECYKPKNPLPESEMRQIANLILFERAISEISATRGKSTVLATAGSEVMSLFDFFAPWGAEISPPYRAPMFVHRYQLQGWGNVRIARQVAKIQFNIQPDQTSLNGLWRIHRLNRSDSHLGIESSNPYLGGDALFATSRHLAEGLINGKNEEIQIIGGGDTLPETDMAKLAMSMIQDAKRDGMPLKLVFFCLANGLKLTTHSSIETISQQFQDRLGITPTILPTEDITEFIQTSKQVLHSAAHGNVEACIVAAQRVLPHAKEPQCYRTTTEICDGIHNDFVLKTLMQFWKMGMNATEMGDKFDYYQQILDNEFRDAEAQYNQGAHKIGVDKIVSLSNLGIEITQKKFPIKPKIHRMKLEIGKRKSPKGRVIEQNTITSLMEAYPEAIVLSQEKIGLNPNDPAGKSEGTGVYFSLAGFEEYSRANRVITTGVSEQKHFSLAWGVGALQIPTINFMPHTFFSPNIDAVKELYANWSFLNNNDIPKGAFTIMPNKGAGGFPHNQRNTSFFKGENIITGFPSTPQMIAPMYDRLMRFADNGALAFAVVDPRDYITSQEVIKTPIDQLGENDIVVYRNTTSNPNTPPDLVIVTASTGVRTARELFTQFSIQEITNGKVKTVELVELPYMHFKTPKALYTYFNDLPPTQVLFYDPTSDNGALAPRVLDLQNKKCLDGHTWRSASIWHAYDANGEIDGQSGRHLIEDIRSFSSKDNN